MMSRLISLVLESFDGDSSVSGSVVLFKLNKMFFNVVFNTADVCFRNCLSFCLPMAFIAALKDFFSFFSCFSFLLIVEYLLMSDDIESV